MTALLALYSTSFGKMEGPELKLWTFIMNGFNRMQQNHKDSAPVGVPV